MLLLAMMLPIGIIVYTRNSRIRVQFLCHNIARGNLPYQLLVRLLSTQKVAAQRQSMLLRKLPLELRLKIYELVLAGNRAVLRMIRLTPNFITGKRCGRYHWETQNHNFKWHHTFYPKYTLEGRQRSNHLLLMLLSCRMTYVVVSLSI